MVIGSIGEVQVGMHREFDRLDCIYTEATPVVLIILDDFVVGVAFDEAGGLDEGADANFFCTW